MSDIPSLVCDPLPAIGLDRQVFQVVEPFDVFGVNAMGGLVEGFKWVDELFCPGVILIHREGRWFTGKMVARHKFNEATGEARLHLRAFGSIREISPVDAMEWFDANFKYLPEQAADLFRRGVEPVETLTKPKKQRGRRPDTDFAADQRIFDAWKSGRYANKKELADALGWKPPDVKRVIDRVRKRPKTARRQ